MWLRDRDFGCERNRVAVGGRVVDLRTPSGVTEDLLVPLRGPHQGDNAACSLAATEAFFGRPLDRDVVAEAFASVTVPGRVEIVHRRPLVVLDGAHNPDGARALRATLEDDFGGRAPDVLVVGFTGGRDPGEMLRAMGADRSRLVIATKPPSPRGVDPAMVAGAAEAMGLRAEVVPSVTGAVERALGAAGDDEFVLVTGSLHAVGEARSVLVTTS